MPPFPLPQQRAPYKTKGGTSAGVGASYTSPQAAPTQGAVGTTVTPSPVPKLPTFHPASAGLNAAVTAAAPTTIATNTPTPGMPSLGSPELDKLRDDITASHQSSWADTEKGLGAQRALDQRRAAAINASMGRTVGGGFGSMMASAQVRGEQAYLNARQEWKKQGEKMQFGFLDRALEEERRVQDLEKEANVPTGSLEDPMPASAMPPGAKGIGAGKRYVSTDGKNVIVEGYDGKYYTMTVAEYEAKGGTQHKGLPAPPKETVPNDFSMGGKSIYHKKD